MSPKNVVKTTIYTCLFRMSSKSSTRAIKKKRDSIHSISIAKTRHKGHFPTDLIPHASLPHLDRHVARTRVVADNRVNDRRDSVDPRGTFEKTNTTQIILRQQGYGSIDVLVGVGDALLRLEKAIAVIGLEKLEEGQGLSSCGKSIDRSVSQFTHAYPKKKEREKVCQSIYGY